MLCLPPMASAQYALDPVSTALGQSGIASTGYRAIHTNPAQLMVRSGPGRWQIGLFEGGLYHNHGGVAFSGSRLAYVQESYRPFDYTAPLLTESQRQDLLADWFPMNRDRFDKISTASVQLLGVSYTGDERAVGFSARLRTYSTMTIGRGWYEDIPQFEDSTTTLNRTLRQQNGAWLELSLALARNLDFFTGMTAGNNRLLFGLAPKVIIAGPRLDATYTASYSPSGNGALHGSNSYSVHASGYFSEVMRDYFTSRSAQQPFEIEIPENSSWLREATGYGFGTDFGLSYEIHIGEVDSYTGEGDHVQLSLSMTDLGFIVYGKNVYSREVSADTLSIPAAQTGRYEPTGRVGDFFYLIEEQAGDRSVLDRAPKTSANAVAYSLPSALQGGVSIHYGRYRGVAQVSTGLNLQSGNTRDLRVSLGSEFRVLPALPLRGGVAIDRSNGAEFTLGAGIDARYVELSAAARLRPPSSSQGWMPTAVGVGALQIRF